MTAVSKKSARCPTCGAPVDTIFDHLDRDCENDEELQERINECVELGYLTVDGDGSPALTAEGRRFFGIPDDKTLVQIGLEVLVDEVISEEMEKQAGRPFSEKQQ